MADTFSEIEVFFMWMARLVWDTMSLGLFPGRNAIEDYDLR